MVSLCNGKKFFAGVRYVCVSSKRWVEAIEYIAYEFVHALHCIALLLPYIPMPVLSVCLEYILHSALFFSVCLSLFVNYVGDISDFLLDFTSKRLSAASPSFAWVLKCVIVS